MTSHFCSLNSAGLSSSQDRFFQYILVSQLETVEACVDLTYKLAQNENTINYLLNRVNLLEDSIKDMRNLITAANQKSNFYDQNVDTVSNQDSIFKLYDAARAKYPKKADFFGKAVECFNSEQNYQGNGANRANLQISPIIPNGTVKITNHYHQPASCCCGQSAKGVSEVEEKTKIKPDLNLLAIEGTDSSQPGIDIKEAQREFNKHVKYEVNRKFGANYLFDHQVRELDLKKMHKIRDKVVKLFKPFPIPINKAWDNAMNSLRQDRHQLKKKKGLISRK